LPTRTSRRYGIYAGDHWCEDHGLPLDGRLVLDKVTAFATIAFLEGRPRPLRRERRRPRTKMPEQLRDAQPPLDHPAVNREPLTTVRDGNA